VDCDTQCVVLRSIGARRAFPALLPASPFQGRVRSHVVTLLTFVVDGGQSEGKVVYYGPTSKVIHYFSS
jgi:hypothetical protein